jgi:transposase InsO family protein/transposase
MSAAIPLAAEIGIVPACGALGLPRSAFYRDRQMRRPVPLASTAKVAHARAWRPPLALSPAERHALLKVLNSPRFINCAPPAVHAQLLDEGRYLGSVRTMYRVLHSCDAVRERRDQCRHPVYEKPELLAAAPNSVWSWDITKLKGPVKGTCFHLYVILDIFSRYVVGWMVAERETAELAEQLIADSTAKEAIAPGTLTLHADCGTSMAPESVHVGRAAQIREQRQVTLNAAFRANPSRFKNKRPQPPRLPTAAWINPPHMEKKVARHSELNMFAMIPKRWMVERSFAWLEKCRRLWKNCKRKLHTSLQFVALISLPCYCKDIEQVLRSNRID